MSLRSLILCVLCGLAADVYAAPGVAPVPEKIDFNRDVRPILSENCFFCHGPDKNKRKADVRLDTREGLFAAIEGKRFPAVAGHPEQSEIIKRIVTKDDEERMPDPKSGKHLSEREIAVLTKWIQQGAEFKGHWAYIKPVKAPVPQTAGPADSSNPVDAFLLSKLREQNLNFSKEADRVTLIRRLYFDILGLPPTPAQVDAFVNDTSPSAYEKLVDQLLASPHFGERMAVYWLDLVRFADTIGYHSDTVRDIVPYRDWVINAFNSNQPFDQFTVEQLAGDLLPNATVSQKVASGYNRLLQTTEEGGAQPKEYIAKYNADRVRNFSSVWMAGTMGCCECHDHKFDPYSTKDFYSLAAFFADVKEPGVGRREPGMPVPDAKQAAELARLEGAVAATKKILDTQTPELAAAQQQWEASLADYRQVDWTPLTVVDVIATSGAYPKFGADQSVSINRVVPEKDVYTVRLKTTMKGITALRLDALTDKATQPKLGRGPDGQFILTGFTAVAGDNGKAPAIEFAAASASIEAPVVVEKAPAKSPAKTKTVAPAESSALEVDSATTKGPGLHTAASTLIASGPGWSSGAVITDDQNAVFELKQPLGDGKETPITVTLKFEAGKKHVLGRFRISATNASTPVRAVKGKELPKEIATFLKIDRAKRVPAQADKIVAYFRSVTPLLDSARTQLAQNEKSRDDFIKTVPRSLIAVADTPQVIKVLPRGNWNTDAGEVVGPATPHFLAQVTTPDPKARPTRLDLAKWTVSKDNPLTARVFVNRLWKMFFGTGISKSLEDLGSQGEWPTHPELLDYLACEFQEPAAGTAWDVKRMIRLLVTSKAYRQTSYASPELKEIDPFNRLLARQGRYRLDAEFVRDNALAVSGLLAEKIGGESVKPYQPAGYWEFLNFPTRTWVHDKDEKEYRRGLYTHWQRSFLHPSLVNFDAPSREECTAERPRSNTPQQALTLLNDPTYVEAARVFAQRILKEGGADVASKLNFAWRTALSRQPKPQELEVLSALYAKHKEQYAQDQKSADALTAIGEAPKPKDLEATELAAWTSVSRTILNLHETITRH